MKQETLYRLFTRNDKNNVKKVRERLIALVDLSPSYTLTLFLILDF